jgi:alcohol dehydrogenase class IV
MDATLDVDQLFNLPTSTSTTPIIVLAAHPTIMHPFVYNPHPVRVVFGSGTVSKVKEEMARLNCSKAVILTTPQQVNMGKQLESIMGDVVVGSYNNATMHTPMDVTKDAVDYVSGKGADCVVAIGGGSTTGLAKAIALRTDLPQIVLPTTYAGSEVGRGDKSAASTHAE